MVIPSPRMNRPPAIRFRVSARCANCIGCWFWIGTTPVPTSMVSTSRMATASTVSRSGSYGIWVIQTRRKPSSRSLANSDTTPSMRVVPPDPDNDPRMLICMPPMMPAAR
jgi:hypothetical protein